MGLIDQVARFFRGLGGGTGLTLGAPTTTEEVIPPLRPTLLTERLRAEVDRRSIVTVCRRMYRTDPRAEGAIRTLARDMVRGGFTVSVPGHADAEEIATSLVQRLSLEQRLDDWVRLTLRDGDSFLELGINGQREIAKITRKPALQMHRNSDEFDQFLDPEHAFWWVDEMWTGMDAPAGATWFAEWQIVQARWGHDEDSRYGTPLFGSATSAFKRVNEGELDMAVRRKTRSGMKYIHKFPEGTSEAAITTYREQNKVALDNPTAAIADFFGTVDIKTVQGDGTLSENADVMHHIRTWWVDSPVPLSLLGYGQDLNRDVLDPQKEQYQNALEGLTPWVEAEIVRPILERQWLLAGIWPAGLKYEIKWKSRGALTAAALKDIGAAVISLRAAGVPEAAIWTILERFLPGIDFSVLAQQPGGGANAPADAAPAGRVAGVASALGDRLSGG